MGIRNFDGHICVIGLDVSKMDFGISLIQYKKSKGPSMEPDGAPSLTGSHLENYCFSFIIYNYSLETIF